MAQSEFWEVKLQQDDLDGKKKKRKRKTFRVRAKKNNIFYHPHNIPVLTVVGEELGTSEGSFLFPKEVWQTGEVRALQGLQRVYKKKKHRGCLSSEGCQGERRLRLESPIRRAGPLTGELQGIGWSNYQQGRENLPLSKQALRPVWLQHI